MVSTGTCLAIIAGHFLETWEEVWKRSNKSRAQQVRERDGDQCQVPGCSHPATDAHHIELRSHGGSDDPENEVAVCRIHQLRCITEGWLRVVGRAPDRLTWFRWGEPWTGGVLSHDAATGAPADAAR